MADALISLGSNIGNPLAALQQAMDHLAEDPAIRIKMRSSFYRTTPVGPVAQDDFINAAVLVSTSFSPDELMQHLLDIETKMGRDRTHAIRFGPRVIDLDLILYDDVKIKIAQLTREFYRKHPEAQELLARGERIPPTQENHLQSPS